MGRLQMTSHPAVTSTTTTTRKENGPPSTSHGTVEAAELQRARKCPSIGEMHSLVHSKSHGPNVAAAALGRTVQLQRQFYFRTLQKRRTAEEEKEMKVADELIAHLLTKISFDLQSSAALNVYSLSNVLKSLSQLSNRLEFQSELSSLAPAICTAALSNDNAKVFVTQAGLPRLVGSLVALAKLNRLHHHHDKQHHHRTLLIAAIAQRLQQGDFVDRMSPADITNVLWSLAVMPSSAAEASPCLLLFKILWKRLGKREAIRTSLQGPEIARLLWSTHRILRFLHQSATGDFVLLRGLAAKACKALTAELGNHTVVVDDSPAQGEEYGHTPEKESSTPLSPPPLKLDSLSAGNIVDILTCCSLLETRFTNQTIANLLMQRLTSPAMVSTWTCSQIAQLLSSVQQLGLPTQQAHCLGEQFLYRVQQSGVESCTSKELSKTWRAVALLTKNATHQAETMTPVLEAGRLLLLNENLAPKKEFLCSCDHMTFSFLVWALAMMEIVDESPLVVALMKGIVENDQAENCNADAAARILWALTKLSFHNKNKPKTKGSDETETVRSLLPNVFTCLSGALLADDISPAAAATAMWATARSCYTNDLGVFDHLAEKMSEPSMLERATTAQVTMALWSCGRMIAWEDPLSAKMEYGVHGPPPYLERAKALAQFLACEERRPQPLSPSGVAQATWAMGRLQMMDAAATVQALADEAMRLSNDLNAQEIANVLWGWSKVGYTNAEAKRTLSRKLLPLAAQGDCNAQEAASVLYALAKTGSIGAPDKVVFRAMTTVLMDQMQCASSQAIANALWAYETAGMNAPAELLQAWAQKRLGLPVAQNEGLFVVEEDFDDNDASVMEGATAQD